MADKRLLYYTEGEYAYQIDTPDDNTTYVCYSDSDKRIIKKIVKSGTVTTILFSFGSWDDRATLSYFPICRPIDLDELEP